MAKLWERTTKELVATTLGKNTFRKWFKDTTTEDATNTFFCIKAITDTVFATLTDKFAHTGILDGIEISAGTELIGQFTNIELTSGIIEAFAVGSYISAFADGVGITTVTSANHGLSDGDTIVISNTKNYNGKYDIDESDTNTFEITATFIKTETGFMVTSSIKKDII